MSHPRVSVIIPTFDRLNLLIEALDSVRAQTVNDYEVIVVDDGSNENIEAGVANHETRPLVVRQPQQGPAQARNLGVSRATGEWIAFLDSDDLWFPEKLETYLRRIDADPSLNIVYGPMLPVDVRGKQVPGRTKPCYGGQITDRLFHSSFVHVPTVMIRRSIFLESGGFRPELPVCEDYDLWLRQSLKYPFELISEPLAYRRLHGNRLSKQLMSRNLMVKADVLRSFFQMAKGSGVLDEQNARARLARVFFVAARECANAGQWDMALNYCRECRDCGGSPLRCKALAASIGVRRILGGKQTEARDVSELRNKPAARTDVAHEASINQ